jgi:hypothetical protein
VFFIVGKQAQRTIAQIGDFVADGLEAFDEAGGAEYRGRLFTTGREGGGAGGGTDEGKLVRLTDDFDRQWALLALQ